MSSLIPIAIGAYITSQASGCQPASRGILDAVVHKDVAVAVGILALSLVVWQSLEQEGSLLGYAGYGCVLSFATRHSGRATITKPCEESGEH